MDQARRLPHTPHPLKVFENPCQDTVQKAKSEVKAEATSPIANNQNVGAAQPVPPTQEDRVYSMEASKIANTNITQWQTGVMF